MIGSFLFRFLNLPSCIFLFIYFLLLPLASPLFQDHTSNRYRAIVTRIHNTSTTSSAASSSSPSKAVSVLPQSPAHCYSKPTCGSGGAANDEDLSSSSSFSYALRILLLPRSKNVPISRRAAAASGRFSSFKSFFANLFSAFKAVKRVTSTALTVETEGRAEGSAVSDFQYLGSDEGRGGYFTFEEEELLKQSKVS